MCIPLNPVPIILFSYFFLMFFSFCPFIFPYPLSLIPYPLSLIPYPLSLIPYPLLTNWLTDPKYITFFFLNVIFAFVEYRKKRKCDQTPANSGTCRAAFKRWTFEEGACRKFIYGGCGGNDNRFGNKTECEDVCGVKERSMSLDQELEGKRVCGSREAGVGGVL